MNLLGISRRIYVNNTAQTFLLVNPLHQKNDTTCGKKQPNRTYPNVYIRHRVNWWCFGLWAAPVLACHFRCSQALIWCINHWFTVWNRFWHQDRIAEQIIRLAIFYMRNREFVDHFLCWCILNWLCNRPFDSSIEHLCQFT